MNNPKGLSISFTSLPAIVCCGNFQHISHVLLHRIPDFHGSVRDWFSYHSLDRLCRPDSTFLLPGRSRPLKMSGSFHIVWAVFLYNLPDHPRRLT